MTDDDYTRILLRGEGENNSTTFADASRCHRPIYNIGTNVVVSTSQSKWGNGSAAFNGYNAYLGVSAIPDLNCGTLPFTIGVWAYRNGGGSYATLFGTGCGWWRPGAQKLDWGNNGTNVLSFNTYSSGYVDAGSAVSWYAWHYIEIYRSGTTIGLSIDGGTFRTATISDSATFDWGYGGAFLWGAAVDAGNQWFGGYMQDFRFLLGTVLHTTSFTPPSRLDDSSFVPSAVIPSEYRRDILDGGNHRIVGTASRLGAVGSYRVRLYDRYDGRLIREGWSASNGAFTFDYLAYRANRYFAVAHDHTGTPLNAAIQDLISPTMTGSPSIDLNFKASLPSDPLIARLSGIAQFSDGSVATTVEAYRRDSAVLVGSTTPDPATGAFQIDIPCNTPCDVVQYKPGYRPLMHGPVDPILL